MVISRHEYVLHAASDSCFNAFLLLPKHASFTKLAFRKKSPAHHVMMKLHGLATTKTCFKTLRSLWVLDLRRWGQPQPASSSQANCIKDSTPPSTVSEYITSCFSLMGVLSSSVSENGTCSSKKSVCGGQCWYFGGPPKINECVGNTRYYALQLQLLSSAKHHYTLSVRIFKLVQQLIWTYIYISLYIY